MCFRGRKSINIVTTFGLLLISYTCVSIIINIWLYKSIPANSWSYTPIIARPIEILQQRTYLKETRPCLTPYTKPLSEQLHSRLKQKGMLPYFMIGTEYMISIPEWQKKLQNHNKTNENMYSLTAVLRVRLYAEDKAKWTIRELKQWLHYQFWAGAEHVYICNHFLKESEKVALHLNEYVNRNLVTIYEWNHIKAIPGTKDFHKSIMNNQVGCYKLILDRHRNESVWQYSIDMDENPYVSGDTCEGFFKRYLLQLNDKISQVKMENFVFQGQGDRSRDLLYDRITRISPKAFNALVKPVYKLAQTKRVGIHEVTVKTQTVVANPKALRMVHYWGARLINWKNDTEQMKQTTVEFTDIRNTIAVSIRHSLVAMDEFDAFSCNTGP